MMTLHDLRHLAMRHAGTGPDCSVPGLRVRSVTAPTLPMSGIEEPMFALILQGRKRSTIGGRTYEYGPGDCVIVSLTMPSTGQVIHASDDEPYLGVALTLRPAEIAGLIVEAEAEAPPAAAPMAVHAASAPLLDEVGRLVTLLDHPDDVRILRPLLEKRSCGACSRARTAQCCARWAWRTAAPRASAARSAGCSSITPNPSRRSSWKP